MYNFSGWKWEANTDGYCYDGIPCKSMLPHSREFNRLFVCLSKQSPRLFFYYPVGCTGYFGFKFYSISEMKIRFRCFMPNRHKAIFTFSKQPFNELKIFATVHSLVNYTILINSCQAHLPVQYALSVELIRWK